MAMSLSETYRRYLENKKPGSDSALTGELFIALLQIISVPCVVEISSTINICDILEQLSPTSAGAANLTTFIALYVKAAITNSYEIKSSNTQMNINRILELIFISKNGGNSSSKVNVSYVLSHYPELGGVEGVLHTIIVAYAFFANESDVTEAYRLSVKAVCCGILADIQSSSRKSFLKCLRCFLIWYFDEGLCRNDMRILYKQYFYESSDILTQSSLKETIATVVDVVGEELMRNSKSMTKILSESLVAKILDLTPLPLAIEVIMEAFLSSTNSRNRSIAVDFLDTILGIICSLNTFTINGPGGHIQSSNSSSQYYKYAVTSIEEISNSNLRCSSIDENGLCYEDKRSTRSIPAYDGFQEILDRSLFFLTDTGEAYR